MLARMIKEAVIVLITELFMMTQLCKLNAVSLSLDGGLEKI